MVCARASSLLVCRGFADMYGSIRLAEGGGALRGGYAHSGSHISAGTSVPDALFRPRIECEALSVFVPAFSPSACHGHALAPSEGPRIRTRPECMTLAHTRPECGTTRPHSARVYGVPPAFGPSACPGPTLAPSASRPRPVPPTLAPSASRSRPPLASPSPSASPSHAITKPAGQRVIRRG